MRAAFFPRAGGCPPPAHPSEKPVLSVVSPVHCEGAGINAFLLSLEKTLDPLGLTWEVILVDDGSTDDSWLRMTEASWRFPWLRCLRLSRNFGKEAALVAGLEAALGRAVITLDSDLQHPPDKIPEIVKLWMSGEADIVEAQKSRRQSESASSRLFARFFYFIFDVISPFDLTNASDFKLLDRKVLEAWKQLPERRLFFRGMSRWVGFKRAEVLFPPEDRQNGFSKWSFVKKLVLALDSLSSYTSKPLSLIWMLGFLFVVLSVILGSEVLWNKISGQAMSGFTTVILLLLITGASVLGSICLLSLYVRQIFHEVKLRPRYLVSESVGSSVGQRQTPRGARCARAPQNRARRCSPGRCSHTPLHGGAIKTFRRASYFRGSSGERL